MYIDKNKQKIDQCSINAQTHTHEKSELLFFIWCLFCTVHWIRTYTFLWSIDDRSINHRIVNFFPILHMIDVLYLSLSLLLSLWVCARVSVCVVCGFFLNHSNGMKGAHNIQPIDPPFKYVAQLQQLIEWYVYVKWQGTYNTL